DGGTRQGLSTRPTPRPALDGTLRPGRPVPAGGGGDRADRRDRRLQQRDLPGAAGRFVGPPPRRVQTGAGGAAPGRLPAGAASTGTSSVPDQPASGLGPGAAGSAANRRTLRGGIPAAVHSSRPRRALLHPPRRPARVP